MSSTVMPLRRLVRLLTRAGMTVATAESCTGGLIAKQITDVPGSSAVFPGGCVTYTNAVKEGLLGVDPSTPLGAALNFVSSPAVLVVLAGVTGYLLSLLPRRGGDGA